MYSKRTLRNVELKWENLDIRLLALSNDWNDLTKITWFLISIDQNQNVKLLIVQCLLQIDFLLLF